MDGKEKVGMISHYFDKVGVALVELSSDIRSGDRILIEGATTSFEQVVESMQIEHETVTHAGQGQAIGLKVEEKVRKGDGVFRI